MNTAVKRDVRITEVRVSDDAISATLADGRIISVPLARSWRLCEASEAQRQNFRLIGKGIGTHWPDIDEYISEEGMLYGIQANWPGNRKTA